MAMLNVNSEFNYSATPLEVDDTIFETFEKEGLEHFLTEGQAIIWRRPERDDAVLQAIDICQHDPIGTEYIISKASELGLSFEQLPDLSSMTRAFKQNAEILAEDFHSVSQMADSIIAKSEAPFNKRTNLKTQCGDGEYLDPSNFFHDHAKCAVVSTTLWGDGFEFAAPGRCARNNEYRHDVRELEKVDSATMQKFAITRLSAGDVIMFHGSNSPFAPLALPSPFLHRGAWPQKDKTRLSAGSAYSKGSSLLASLTLHSQ